ncbi:MAG: hypothetical protein E6J07_10185 [Chloroflexi bacterium]|nr:MAG: hypothetical protein E6J07_10185 [Chloroflexota bacterium]
MLNGIVRVFPALVVEADRRAGLVLLEPIAIAISILEHPLEGGLGVRSVAVEDRLVARPLVGVREHDQEQQRGIGRAVVGREGKEPQTGELPIAQLVRDLAGFLVLLRIVIGGLNAGKPVEGAEGELGKAADALHRDHQ